MSRAIVPLIDQMHHQPRVRSFSKSPESLYPYSGSFSANYPVLLVLSDSLRPGRLCGVSPRAPCRGKPLVTQGQASVAIYLSVSFTSSVEDTGDGGRTWPHVALLVQLSGLVDGGPSMPRNTPLPRWLLGPRGPSVSHQEPLAVRHTRE